MRTLDTDSVVLCSGTLRDASFVETVRGAAAAGFDGVSLYHREYEAARALTDVLARAGER